MSNTTRAVHVKESDGTVVPSTFFSDNDAALALAGHPFLGGDLVAMGTAVGINSGTPFFIVPYDCNVLEVRVVFGGVLDVNGGFVVWRDTHVGESYDVTLQQILNRGFPGFYNAYRFGPQPTAAALLAGDRINAAWGGLGSMGVHGLAIYLVVQRVADSQTLTAYGA